MQTLKKSTVVAVLVVSIGVFRANLVYGLTQFQQSFSGITLSGSFTLSEPATVTKVSANCSSASTAFPTPGPILLVQGVMQGNAVTFSVTPTNSGNSVNWLSVESADSYFDANKPVTFSLSWSLGVSNPTCTADFIGSKGALAAIEKDVLRNHIFGATPPTGLVPSAESATSSGPLFLGYAAGTAGSTLIDGVDVYCSGWSGVVAPLMLGATSNGLQVSWYIPADQNASTTTFAYHAGLLPFPIDVDTTYFLQPLATGGSGSCNGTVSTVQGSSASVATFVMQHFDLGKTITGVTYNFVSANGSSPTLSFPLGSNFGLPVAVNASCSSSASIPEVALQLNETSGGVPSTNPLVPNQNPSLFPFAVGWGDFLRTNVVDSNTTINIQPAVSLGSAVNCDVNLGIVTGGQTALNTFSQDRLYEDGSFFLRLSFIQ